ncbi:MAG: hypothetical protein EXQ86_11860 [Rhodospirillales bacterium]|nr:hypothetical protein [Rhodospirillales bacterium]
MPARLLVPVLCLALTILALTQGEARADVIDGRWCFTDGRGMTISGPIIVTPSGTRTTGDYTRHSFRYKVPEAEPGAGSVVSMVLANEETVYLWDGDKVAGSGRAPDQVWRRCSPIS